ncbi:MAG: hypothetical protein WAS72_07110, partial [Saprospiraceae bacterium]
MKINEIKSVAHFHQLCGLPAPLHPLVSIINFEETKLLEENIPFWKHYIDNLYTISIKRSMNCKFKYGQTDFDYDGGTLVATAPNQVFGSDNVEYVKTTGYKLIFHPDFLHGYSLAKNIHNYGFFSYSNNKGLFLSDKEEKIIINLFNLIEQECENNLDKFSHDVLIANIELLLVHIDRFYNRQFLTRKKISNDTLAKMEEVLKDYFNSSTNQLPTVQFIADQLNLSPS